MKEKDQTYYQKMVNTGRWKKIHKELEDGSEQEKLWIIEAMGADASRDDECFNELVEALQRVTEKRAKLAIIDALSKSERSAAISQLEYMALHTEDPEIQEALKSARHTLKATVKS